MCAVYGQDVHRATDETVRECVPDRQCVLTAGRLAARPFTNRSRMAGTRESVDEPTVSDACRLPLILVAQLSKHLVRRRQVDGSNVSKADKRVTTGSIDRET